jgi:hypothetical protein
VAIEQLLERVPIEPLPARAPGQPLVPEPSDETIERPQTAEVRRTPVVLVVAPEFGIERRGLSLDRVVPMMLAPLRRRLHTAPKTFANGPDVNREQPSSAARTDVRETEEVEGRRPWRIGAARKRRASERQQPRLLGMKRQAVLRESLGEPPSTLNSERLDRNSLFQGDFTPAPA